MKLGNLTNLTNLVLDNNQLTEGFILELPRFGCCLLRNSIHWATHKHVSKWPCICCRAQALIDAFEKAEDGFNSIGVIDD